VYSEQRWGFGYHALTGDSIDALQRFYRLILADLSRGGSHAN
jgi:hypothetical protein